MMVQDIYRNDPWKMLVGCILLNRSKGDDVKKVMRPLFKLCPYPQVVKDGVSIDEMRRIIQRLGLQTRKSESIIRFSECWVANGPPKDSSQVASYPGLGAYAVESYEVFIERRFNTPAKDKEINRYLNETIDMTFVVDSETTLLSIYGKSEIVNGREVQECLNFRYSFADDVFCYPNDQEEKEYIDDKIHTNMMRIKEAEFKLATNVKSRQAVIQFDLSGEAPNCTVAIQFQIREKTLMIGVFQRSQDVEMMKKDCDTFSRIACLMAESLPVDGYTIDVSVGNMHEYRN